MTKIQQIPIVDKLFLNFNVQDAHKKFKCIKNLIKYN